MAPPRKTAPKKVATTLQRLLARKFGGEIELDSGTNIQPDANWRSIYRFKLDTRPDPLPPSLVVKRPRRRGSNQLVISEWAALQFISEQMGEDATAPLFYGGHGGKTLPFVVMEDMGEGQDLYKILRGDNSAEAKAVLIECADALGKINASTLGKAAQFRRTLEAIDPTGGEQSTQESPGGEIEQKFTEICEAAGIKPHREALSQLKNIAHFLDSQNPFHALTHADLCPVNIFHSTSHNKVYVFDYEEGRFQHALVDGYQIRIHLDYHLEVSRFPDEIMLEMEATYRRALAAHCPEARDDSWYYRRLIEACVYEMIRCIYRFSEPPQAVFSNILRDREVSDYEALKNDNYDHWCLPAVRRRVFYRLGLLAQLTEEYGYLQALGGTAKKIKEKFCAIWPPEVHEMPRYPVFR
ncbi:MAG: phosphotransferase [Candidatus Latescibacteria bacterium]|nr:phosphotransferase [Candidatus Latescibacterota bacterium]